MEEGSVARSRSRDMESDWIIGITFGDHEFLLTFRNRDSKIPEQKDSMDSHVGMVCAPL